ncbi:MAG: hypothetical protein P1P60_06330 [Treponema phagedenis]|uniref:Uncharacterized protein n=2 Tax=Treponema phagedenis TaxID=162 RepID=A0A0B7H1Y4_TREPH|nr:hypothetical protein TPHV1_510018 [Treponema phagedenis]
MDDVSHEILEEFKAIEEHYTHSINGGDTYYGLFADDDILFSYVEYFTSQFGNHFDIFPANINLP